LPQKKKTDARMLEEKREGTLRGPEKGNTSRGCQTPHKGLEFCGRGRIKERNEENEMGDRGCMNSQIPGIRPTKGNTRYRKKKAFSGGKDSERKLRQPESIIQKGKKGKYLEVGGKICNLH